LYPLPIWWGLWAFVKKAMLEYIERVKKAYGESCIYYFKITKVLIYRLKDGLCLIKKPAIQ
jgi:hypothetical protein